MYISFIKKLSIIPVIKNFFIIQLFLCFSCQDQQSLTAENLIAKSTKAHGFDKIKLALEFDFRDYHYELIRKPSFYSYSRETEKKGKRIKDVMVSEKKLQRYVNDTLILLSDSIANVYSNSLNSVLYFFLLLKMLKDPAVIADIQDPIYIKGISYWTLKITFNQEDGGEDFQDEYLYWINKRTFLIDYLAYNYMTDNGGTRFRKAINQRKIGGYIFQDYENYMPEQKNIPLVKLPILYMGGKLKQVSIIENKNISFLKEKIIYRLIQ